MHKLTSGSSLTSADLPAWVRLARCLSARLRGVRRSPGGFERGAALVEFALVVPLLIPLIAMLMEFGMAFNYKNQLTQMASQGARWAAVNKNPGPGGSLQESILDTAVGNELKVGGTTLVPNPAHVCISPGTGKGQAVTVTATVAYDWLPFRVPFLKGVTKTFPNVTQSVIRGSSTMMLEKAPDAYSGGCFPA